MSEDNSSFNTRYNSALLERLEHAGIQLSRPRKPYFEHRQIFDSWAIHIDTAAKILKSKNQISVDLTLKSAEAGQQFVELEKDKMYYNDIIGGEVKWESGLRKERHIVAVLSADPTDESDWPRQHAWLAARLVSFRIAFGPAITRMTTSR